MDEFWIAKVPLAMHAFPALARPTIILEKLIFKLDELFNALNYTMITVMI